MCDFVGSSRATVANIPREIVSSIITSVKVTEWSAEQFITVTVSDSNL